MEKNLHNIVDIEKYPINDLSSPKIKDLVKKCKDELILIVFYQNH